MEYSIENLNHILSSINDDFISESHLAAEIYFKLRYPTLNIPKKDIYLEFPYSYNSRLKCDIYIEGHPKVWIELKTYLKTETASTRSKKHTNPKSSPFKDCNKLGKLPKEDYKIIVIYKNVRFEPKNNSSWEHLTKECEKLDIKLIYIDT